MSNTLTAVMPRLLAMGMLALRQNAVTPRLVNRALEATAGEKGSTIDVPLPVAMTAADVSPSASPPSTTAITPTYESVALNRWKEVAFFLTDKDWAEINEGIFPMQASEAIKALANEVDSFLLSLGNKFYGYVGTAGTTPFASDTSVVTDARKVLNKQLAPLDDRVIILDPDAEAKALGLANFIQALQAGTDQGIKEGTIGRKFGFDWYMNQNVQSHTAGTITTGLIAKASTAVAVGLKTLVATTAASTGACALKAGDVITFANDTQTYVLTADATQASAATDVTLTFEPGLKVAKVGSEAITVKATHVMNIAMHRNAMVFASRPLKKAEDGLGVISMSAADPISGLTLRLEVTRENKRTRYAWDILYGANVIRRELGCRIAG